MTLPNLPEPAMVYMDAQGYSTPCYTSEQMQEYALAALRAQPDHRELVKRIRNLGSASGFGARAALLHEAADALEGI